MAKYHPGDFVRLASDSSVQGAVMKVYEGLTETKYQVFTVAGPQLFYETQLRAVSIQETFQAVDAAQLRAALSAALIRTPALSSLYSLHTGQIDFIPHQYRPVLKLLRSDRPRILIADGVGVGKTIEAGLILRELQARRDLDSALVICPRPLVAERKWEQEMKRFGETFEALDGSSFRYCLREYDLEGEWPDKYKRAILPYSLFDETNVMGGTQQRNPGLLSLEPPPSFDLVIVDEAHHVRNPSTYAYRAVKRFCDNAEAVALLTATPVQMKYDDLFTLLNLLRPDLIIDRDTFYHMAEPNAFIGRASALARSQEENWEQLTLTELQQACENTEWGRTVLSENPAARRCQEILRKPDISPEERIQLIGDLESLHSFSNIISRTRRRDIGEFTVRKAITEEVPFTDAQKAVHDEILQITREILSRTHGTENVKFLMTTIRRQTASCLFGLVPMLDDILYRHADEWIDDECLVQAALFMRDDENAIRQRIQEVIRLANALPPDDPKLERLSDILRDRRRRPEGRVMVFSSFLHTLRYLYEKLSARGIRVGLIHGGVPDEERRALRERFALPTEHPDALDVLLFSEVGCEGLDYQFCDCMVNYDLPWNPMRIEQRIGRIDRNGQKSESVSIFNLVTPDTVDYDIYQRCTLRIGVFKESIGDCEEILGDFSGEARDIAENFSLTPEERAQKLQQLADNKIRLIQERIGLEEKQKDLFTLQLPRNSLEQELHAAKSFWLTPESLANMVHAYLKQRLGAERKYFLREGARNTLRLSSEDRQTLWKDFQERHFPKNAENRTWEKALRSGGQWISVTFDRENEDRDAVLISASHPLVKQAAKFLNVRNIVVSLRLRTDCVPPGIYPFIIYQWRFSGEREDLRIRPLSVSREVTECLREHLAECQDGAVLRVEELSKSQPAPGSAGTWDDVDRLCHAIWEEELSEHKARTRELIRYREGSLTTSHKARIAFINQQLQATSDGKIRRMREGELRNAEADYQWHMDELREAERKADILSEPLAYGVIEIEPTENSASQKS